MEAKMNKIERARSRTYGRSWANYASTLLKFPSSTIQAATFGPISTAC